MCHLAMLWHSPGYVFYLYRGKAYIQRKQFTTIHIKHKSEKNTVQSFMQNLTCIWPPLCAVLVDSLWHVPCSQAVAYQAAQFRPTQEIKTDRRNSNGFFFFFYSERIISHFTEGHAHPLTTPLTSEWQHNCLVLYLLTVSHIITVKSL